jgi:hypothetical protein
MMAPLPLKRVAFSLTEVNAALLNSKRAIQKCAIRICSDNRVGLSADRAPELKMVRADQVLKYGDA